MKRKKHEKVSIITTFYNSENYILKCINSVNSQIIDGFDLEYILVDDGSKDNTARIIDIFFDEYKNKDLEVKRINNIVNYGCGVSRQIGINHASGDYVMFLDADDYYLMTDFVSRAYSIITNNNADIVEFGFKYVDNTGKRHKVVSESNLVIENSQMGNMQAMFYDALIMFMPWTKIIRKDIVDSREYDSTREFEDIRTTPYWVWNSKKILIQNTVEINYRAVHNSIIRKDPHETRLGTVEAICSLFESFKSNKGVLKAMYDRCMTDLRTITDEDPESEYFKKMSLLNTKMLSYIYPDTYKEMTYDIEFNNN